MRAHWSYPLDLQNSTDHCVVHFAYKKHFCRPHKFHIQLRPPLFFCGGSLSSFSAFIHTTHNQPTNPFGVLESNPTLSHYDKDDNDDGDDDTNTFRRIEHKSLHNILHLQGGQKCVCVCKGIIAHHTNIPQTNCIHHHVLECLVRKIDHSGDNQSTEKGSNDDNHTCDGIMRLIRDQQIYLHVWKNLKISH